MATRDGYSGFAFYNAITPQDIATGVALDGETIDTRGYETCVFILNHDTMASASLATSVAQLILQNGLASDNGVSVWSDAHPRDIIHSVIGLDGAYSTSAELGIVQSMGDVDSSRVSGQYIVGYKGSHRYVRLRVSQSAGAAHGFSAAAICILGLPNNWPVNIPV